MRFAALIIFLTTAVAAHATVYQLVPADLGNGYSLSGSIETDGTIGYLLPGNYRRWNIVVTQTTDTVFTEKNSRANLVSVTTDGRRMSVPTSPDGFTDGGALNFMTGSRIDPWLAMVADFTGANIVGGAGGWATASAYNIVGLNQPDASHYAVATALRPGTLSHQPPHAYGITPVLVSTSPTTLRLFGTIVTDGTVGALTAANLRAWHIVGREEDVQKYTEATSHVLGSAQVRADGATLRIENPNGLLQFGIPVTGPRGRPVVVTIADFTDPSFPGGYSSYVYGVFGQVAIRTPLTSLTTYVIARKR